MKLLTATAAAAIMAVSGFVGTAMAGGHAPATLNQAVNMFENGKFTGGAKATVDAKGPVKISDAVELPGFAFAVYDVDVTSDSLTMTLIAKLEKLMITKYDDTTFDRYYFEFDKPIKSATIADSSDENFSATVELIAPGTEVKSAKAFVEGMATDYSFENGGILITVGEGTDLVKITEAGGSLTVNF